jgi:hypothetical protein
VCSSTVNTPANACAFADDASTMLSREAINASNSLKYSADA